MFIGCSLAVRVYFPGCLFVDYFMFRKTFTFLYAWVQIIDCLCAKLPAEGKVSMAQKLSYLCGGISDEKVIHDKVETCSLCVFVLPCALYIGQSTL